MALFDMFLTANGVTSLPLQTMMCTSLLNARPRITLTSARPMKPRRELARYYTTILCHLEIFFLIHSKHIQHVKMLYEASLKERDSIINHPLNQQVQI